MKILKDTRPNWLMIPLGMAFLLLAVCRAEAYESGPRQAHLVELYTSEGCSSCPPADEWLTRFKNSKELWVEVVPVAFHVDFWDYIGWKDPYAQNIFTRRLQSIVRAWKMKSLYTPCVIQNGAELRGWYNLKKIARSRNRPGILKAVRTSPKIYDITFTPTETPKKSFVAVAALLGMDLVSEVKSGENEGKTLRHDFVVLETRQVAMTAEGGVYKAHLSFEKDPKEKLRESPPRAVAFWVSSEKTPVPIQATGGFLD